MSRHRKSAAVLRLPRARIWKRSRALGVTAATLTSWRDAFLAAGEAALTSRPTHGETLESERLKARLGECCSSTNELLERKITSLEGGRPFVRRRSK
jgi:transposase-like protein